MREEIKEMNVKNKKVIKIIMNISIRYPTYNTTKDRLEKRGNGDERFIESLKEDKYWGFRRCNKFLKKRIIIL